MVMFSGGLDSTILAALLCDLLPSDVGLDLVNVSFSPNDSPDRITSIISFFELLKRKSTGLRLICADYDAKDIMKNEDI